MAFDPTRFRDPVHAIGSPEDPKEIDANAAASVISLLKGIMDAISSSVSTVTVTTASYTILPTNVEIFVNRAGPVTLTLPDAATWALNIRTGIPLTIKDISGAAGVNNITINRAGSNTIDGLTSLLISSNYGGFQLRPTAAGWAIVG